ncbi:hypothetical protein ABT336_14520 [Micromonospora sp. NPDC000207]|uniref:hypothetical protein n=1 Tax=Micromonospora sp. NPDC000207 TaxID=3154246 RepID=UPI0033204693
MNSADSAMNVVVILGFAAAGGLVLAGFIGLARRERRNADATVEVKYAKVLAPTREAQHRADLRRQQPSPPVDGQIHAWTPPALTTAAPPVWPGNTVHVGRHAVTTADDQPAPVEATPIDTRTWCDAIEESVRRRRDDPDRTQFLHPLVGRR